MVRQAQYRQSKFVAKIDPEIVKQRFEVQKEMMAEQTTQVFSNQAEFETKIGKFLNELGLYGIQLHHYRNFAQELYSLTRRFYTNTLSKEATLVAKKWLARGLEEQTLRKVAQFFGIELGQL
jgi:copper oxidase (laccase) domain-containing protein